MAENIRPIIVDDSQMFGGVIEENYRSLPEHTRVLGDHGGFVGAGIAYAAGYALADPRGSMWCLLGDFGYLNGLKGLYAAVEHSLNIVFVVCNNGGAISLGKQQSFDMNREECPAAFQLMANMDGMDYCAIARGLGMSTFRIDARARKRYAEQTAICQKVLGRVAKARKPALVEVLAPSEMEAWKGIWATSGLETRVSHLRTRSDPLEERRSPARHTG